MYTLQDFGTFILYFFGILAIIGGIVAVIFLISTLNNVNKLLKRVDGVIEKNEDKITQTVDNVNDITRTVKYGVDKVESTTQAIEESVCDAIISFSEKTDSFFDFVTISKQVIKTILKVFPFDKKK
ncbi:MAG TPA: DUF948 domain-containing protein [Clostridium sp.]|jgi:uncharacterized protein YoxC|nr:DUF948 domain-containing protein [Clostridium sp.]